MWEHQRVAFERAASLEEFLLLFEMGAGKTMTAINIARGKFAHHKRMLKTLIFCPPIVTENWKREWLMHSNVPEAEIVILRGSQKERVALAEKYIFKPVIFITNYESLLMEDLYHFFQMWKPELIIWDELHKLKNQTSKRTKKAIPLGDAALYRLGLTGTPVLNSPMDLFTQVRACDKGKLFGKNFFAFRARYFYDKNAGMPKQKYFPNWVPNPKTYEELNARLKTISMHVKKEDCMDLPPLVRVPITVGMTKEQERMYKEMKEQFVTYIGDTAAVADLAITKALRLQQIVSGFVKLEDGTILNFKNHPRREALKQLLEEMTPDHKVIVWATFKENYKDIREVCNELGIEFAEVHGDVVEKDRMANVDRFNNDPKCRVIFGHPGSGGIGINLVVSDISVFYSRGFSLEHDLQAEARNYRGGSEQHSKVTRYDLFCPGTIEEIVLSKLSNKIDVGNKILREIAKEL